MTFVVPLVSAAGALGKSGCGAKAFELSKLLQSGYVVPDGFVLTDKTYRRIVDWNKLRGVAAESLPKSLTEADIPPDVLNELTDSFDALIRTYGSVSIRSSSTMEDLEDASFAGQYETVLNVKSREGLFAALGRCWASLTDSRVSAYADEKGIALTDCRMPLLIQGMVRAEQAGVAFSIHPVTFEETIVVNISYGLGEAIVSGLVTPDTFLYSKTSGELHKELGFKELKTVFGDEGVVEHETTPLEQSQFCISDDQVYDLCKIVTQLEDWFGTPVDVEFAYQAKELFILQVRAITTTRRGLSV